MTAGTAEAIGGAPKDRIGTALLTSGAGVVFVLFMGRASVALPLGASATAPLAGATYLGYGLFSLVALGMSATIYRLRVDNPAAVADVFD